MTAADKQTGIKTADAGLSVDYAATVSAAGKSSLNPIAIIRSLTTDRSVDPVVTTTGDGMQKTVARIAKWILQKPSEGAIDFSDGTARPVEPKPGRALDAAGTPTVLEAAYGGGASRAEVPVNVAPPTVDAAEVQRAMEELGRPAVDSSVTLQVDGHPLDVPVRTFTPYLSTRPVKGKLTLVIDGAGLRDALGSRLAPFEEKAQDASFHIVVASQRGAARQGWRRPSSPPRWWRRCPSQPTGSPRSYSAVDPDITTEEARQQASRKIVLDNQLPYAAYRAPTSARPRAT